LCFNFDKGKDNSTTKLVNDLCGAPSKSASYSTLHRYALIHIKHTRRKGHFDINIDAIAAKDYCK